MEFYVDNPNMDKNIIIGDSSRVYAHIVCDYGTQKGLHYHMYTVVPPVTTLNKKTLRICTKGKKYLDVVYNINYEFTNIWTNSMDAMYDLDIVKCSSFAAGKEYAELVKGIQAIDDKILQSLITLGD